MRRLRRGLILGGLAAALLVLAGLGVIIGAGRRARVALT
jgi:hypothetical protein